MQQMLEWLTSAVGGPPWLALAAALLWGIASVVLSPCHLASIPLIVAYINGQGEMTTRKALAMSSLFAGGILVTIAVIGLITGAAGRMLGSTGAGCTYLVAMILFAVGLHLVGALPMPFSSLGSVPLRRRGYLAAGLLGLVFGLALGPCTFAYMAAILGVVFRTAGEHPVYATALLGAYGMGHCAVIAVAGASTGTVQKYLNWNQQSKAGAVVKSMCGVGVIAGGFWLVYTA